MDGWIESPISELFLPARTYSRPKLLMQRNSPVYNNNAALLCPTPNPKTKNSASESPQSLGTFLTESCELVFELPGLLHVHEDITATHKLSANIHLRDCRPLAESLNALS